MSAESPRRSSGSASRGMVAVPVIVPPQVVSDRSILDSAIGFINEVTLSNQPLTDPKDTITWARFETAADISDPRFGEDWELEGNVAPPLLLILGYGLGVQVWAIPANGEAIEVLSWRHGIVSALRVLPTPTPPTSATIERNGRADEPTDAFAEKRPLIALVDGTSSSGVQPQFCAVNFVSLKTGIQVKTIQFKNPVIEILANRSSVAITFHERIAVFDACSLENRLSITTCYPSPGINPNPVALGQRWLAYAENKLVSSKRSCGGCDGDGVASYTATVLNASKSLVKGLRELGEQVAAGLTGTTGSTTSSKNTSFDSSCGVDMKQSGVVTIIDIKNSTRDYSPTSGVPISSNQIAGIDPIIAHFIAHSEALVALEFDNSGMILVTADRRGHDFHVFRIQPNPVGPSLAAVHHLYILHRGDTSAKVQNITLSLDSRWVAVSTLRGTTHVFPITPYGGAMGVRTHTSLHVVNKLSRFHRSAGLSDEGRSNSPISHSESTTFTQSLQPYHNPTLPPFPRPTVVMPLAQLRQPFALGSPPGSATLTSVKSATSVSGTGSQRQRLSSLSDDSGKPLSVCAIFAKSRSWLLDPPNVTREAPHRMQRKAVDSLFVMAGHGALIQYDLDTKLASNVAREKICDDTPIELEVEAKAQWNLGRRKEGSQEIIPPLSCDNWLIKKRNSCILTDSTRQFDDPDDRRESWLAQVEIITHAGPHRRLWMGPQFVFKTYNTPSGSNLSHVDIEAVEIGTAKSSTTSTSEKLDHSSPLNMPSRASAVPVLIESGSYSSIEQSPKLMDRFRHDHLDSDFSLVHGDSRLKEDLADAMRESPSVTSTSKDTGGHGCESACSSDNIAFYDALTAQEDQDYVHPRSVSSAALASVLPNIHSYENISSIDYLESLKKSKASIEKIVNPLGTVTTVTSCLTADVKTDILDEVVSQLATEENIIHENCDESLFRPVVAIFCDEKTLLQNEKEARKNFEHCQPPETISNKLVVPVISKEVDDEINKKEKKKNNLKKFQIDIPKDTHLRVVEQNKFERFSSSNINPNENDSNLVYNKSLIPKCDEKQNQTICEKQTKISVKHSTDKIDPSTDDIPNDVRTIDVEAINVLSNEQTHKEEELLVTPKNSEKNDLVKPHIQKQSTRQELKNVLEDREMSVIKNKNNKAIKTFNTKDVSINDENQFTISDDSKEQNNTLETKQIDKDSILNESIVDPILFIKEEHEPDTTKIIHKPTDTNSESISKSPLQNLNKSKLFGFDKNSKRDKLKKVNEINKSIKANKNDLQKSSEQLDMQESKNEIRNYERQSNCVNKTDEIKITHSNTMNTGNNKKPFTMSKSENKVNKVSLLIDEETHNLDKKNTLKCNAMECPKSCNMPDNVCQRDKTCSSYKTKTNLDDLNRVPKSIESKKLAANTEITVTCDSKISKKSIIDEEAKSDINAIKCDSKENLNESKSEDNSIKKKCNKLGSLESTNVSILPEKSKGKSEYENKAKDCLEKKNFPKQLQRETKHDNNTEEKSKGTTLKAKQMTTDENKPKENIEQKNQDQTVLNVKKKDDVKNKSKQENMEKVLKNDRTIAQEDVGEKSPDIECVREANEAEASLEVLKEFSKDEHKKDPSLANAINVIILDENKDKNDDDELHSLKKVVKSGRDECQRNSIDITKNLPKSTSAWKKLSGAEMINKNLKISNTTETNKKSLSEASTKPNTTIKTTVLEKLLPELPTPHDMENQISRSKISSKSKISLTLDESSIFKPLEALPSLPALEPLHLFSENKSGILKDISLINFESPIQENPALQRKITPPPRGFTEQNLILALCGSLHYENEQVRASPEKIDLSPTFSSNRSSTALEEPSTADYKSLTENDDLYMSLEHSSQDTNTTNTNTTNDKCFSSTNSSGSEEIVIVEEKKMTKKQKRKRQQQQLQELQKQKEQQQHQQEMDDEELRPLIAMTESQIDQFSNASQHTLPTPTDTDKGTSNKGLQVQTILQSTTTDSEGPMPATTSDDNILCIPISTVHNPQKIKTKKLEHKINLIAAIEAATSSSTSSAEESGVELGDRCLQDTEEPLISLAGSMSSTALPLSAAGTSQVAVGALKKKSKRRKR